MLELPNLQIDLSNDAIFSLASHILGFEHHLSKGSIQKDSLGWLFAALQDSKDSILDRNDTIMNSAFGNWLEQIIFIQKNLNISGKIFPTAASKLADDFINNKHFLYFPIQWENHTISIMIFHKYLAVINRGAGRHADGGIVYYKLKKNLSKSSLESLLNCNPLCFNKLEFENLKQNIIDSFCYVDTTVSNQKYPTCGYANKKSALRAFYTLIECHKQNIHPNEVICEFHRLKYKTFSAVSRLKFLKRLLDTAPNSDEEKNRKFEIILYYSMQHNNFIKNHEQEGMKLIFEWLQKESLQNIFSEKIRSLNYGSTVIPVV